MLKIIRGLMIGAIVFCMSSYGADEGDKGEKIEKTGWVIYKPAKAHISYEHAANELARYIKEMSGVVVSIKTDKEAKPEDKVRLIIGDSAVNYLTKDLISKGKISVPKNLGEGGYFIKSVIDDGRTNIVFAGTRGRGAMYAVYNYLRKYCDCGYFRDGDYIPKKINIPVKNIDFSDIPVFPIREGFAFPAHKGPMSKYSNCWDFEYWKLWADFSVKTGANVLHHYIRWGDIPYKVLDKLDINDAVGRAGDVLAPKDRSELNRKVFDYIRSLDVEIWYGFGGEWGLMPKSFDKAYPGHDLIGGNLLKPEDKEFDSIMRKVWSEFLKEFGKADRYFIIYHPEGQADMRYDAYDKAVKLFRELDPSSKFMFWSWDLDWGTGNKNIEEFNKRLPKDALVQDQSGVKRGLKSEDNHFGGRDWMHCERSIGEFFSGDRLGKGFGPFMGDRIINDGVSAESKIPVGCKGATFYNELDSGNFLVFSLAMDTEWNPGKTKKSFDSGEWLDRYIIERYGKESANNMGASLKETFKANLGDDKYLAGEDKIIDNAVKLALKEKEKQKDNQRYVYYMYDIVTQALSDCGQAKSQLITDSFSKDPKSSDTKVYLDKAKEYIEMLKDIMASQDRDKLSVTFDSITSRSPTADKNQVALAIGARNYTIITYEKWYLNFYRPYVVTLKILEESIAQGKLPAKTEIDATLKKEIRPDWNYWNPKSIKEIGSYKPKKDTLTLIEEAVNKNIFIVGK